jgi:phage N-6-adenine-methyltransferase
MTDQNNALIEINKAQQALERASDIHEILILRDQASALQVFADAQGFKEAAQEAKIYQLKAERKAGEWLDKNVQQGGHKSKSQDETLIPNGVDKHESSHWQQEASVPEDKFNEWIDGCLSTGKEISAAGLRRLALVHISDDSYEWYTPQEYIEAARGVMGGIDLDPASSDKANESIKASMFYTIEQNGLNQPWSGRVWLNPPYNMPWIEKFTGKAVDEYEMGNIDTAIVLVNNATDTGWFHRLINYPVCFTKGRVRFWAEDSSNLATRQGQAIFYLGSDMALFAKIFNKFGVVLVKYDNQ